MSIARTALQHVKSLLQHATTKQPAKTGMSHGRKTYQVKGLPILSRKSSSTSSPPQKTLKSRHSVSSLPSAANKPKLPRTPVNPEPGNLKRMREDNDAMKRLNELPAVPSHTPSAKKSKKSSLPLSRPELLKTIANAKSVQDLVNVWNHLNANTTKTALSMEDRFALKAIFPGKLNMISKLPGQAVLINENILKTMIPDGKKRNNIGLQILERRYQQAFPERNNPLSKG